MHSHYFGVIFFFFLSIKRIPDLSFHIIKCQSEYHVYSNLLSDGLSGRVSVRTTIRPSFNFMSSKGT